MKRTITIVFSFLLPLFLLANAQEPVKVEPPSWWVGMKDKNLQLLVHGKNISSSDVKINSNLVNIKETHRVENPNYIFIDLEIATTKPGSFTITLNNPSNEIYEYEYQLNQKTPRTRGFSSQDMIYLLMPDRFANGNPGNDNVEGMLEESGRANPDGRHGGDIQGIINHLDYIKNLGITTLWINPFLENNIKKFSYHGYSITDFYRTDPRLGNNADYKKLVEQCHNRNMNVIMDVVVNHCGSNHWWMNDLPMKSWINNSEDFKTNYRGATIADPHASEIDRRQFVSGWFVETMPDLNQKNPYLAKYLIQNILWWIEYSCIDGIRMDTQPYAYKEFVTILGKRIRKEYPDFTILGEAWLQKIALTAYFQGYSPISGGYNSYTHSTTDFPMFYAAKQAFNEEDGWTTGLARIYYVLTQDFLYRDAYKNVIFLDNHDLDRYYTSVGEDINKFKMGIALLMTMRGIPMLYYGDEILMNGHEHSGHGNIREDFPGGWQNDTVNAFEENGRTILQNEAYNYIRKLAHWRQSSDAVKDGKLTHFVPEDNTYVYFRHTKENAVMVIFNNHDKEEKTIDCERYKEILENYNAGKDVISGLKIQPLDNIKISNKSVMVIEMLIE